MDNQRISVIVPAYNNAPWIGRCLDSLLAQTYENIEIIAVDDGSLDNTYAIMCAYAEKDSRVKVIHQENAGVTAARLRGVEEATGEWIGFVDGDDMVEPWMYEHLISNACKYGADISHCGYVLIFSDGTHQKHSGTGVLRYQDRNTAIRDLLEGKLIESGLCNKLFKYDLFQGIASIMNYSIKNNEDILMNYYLFSQAKKSVFEDVCPYHYIVREGSVTRRKLSENKIYDPIRVKQIILDDCPPELHEDARGALVRTTLIAYSMLALETEKEYTPHKKNVREMLKEQKSGFYLLTKRNALLANMVCYTPWLFQVAYRFYVKYIQDPYE